MARPAAAVLASGRGVAVAAISGGCGSGSGARRGNFRRRRQLERCTLSPSRSYGGSGSGGGDHVGHHTQEIDDRCCFFALVLPTRENRCTTTRTRVGHTHPASTLRLPHVTFQTSPSPLLTLRTRNDNEAYNAHVSGEAWERG